MRRKKLTIEFPANSDFSVQISNVSAALSTEDVKLRTENGEDGVRRAFVSVHPKRAKDIAGIISRTNSRATVSGLEPAV